MRFIFVDTLYWVAFINPQDQWHQKTREVTAILGTFSLITTEVVLIELLQHGRLHLHAGDARSQFDRGANPR